MTQYPPTNYGQPGLQPGVGFGGPGGYVRPHRGAMILVFGILSWALGCFPFGIVAWVMGNNDLEAMRSGQMDPTGEGLTNAGKIIGMIHVLLCIAVVVLFVALFALSIIGAAATGAAAGSGP